MATSHTYATWLRPDRSPRALVRVIRQYKFVTKVKPYLGDGDWGDVTDAHPREVAYDGGAGWGWRPLDGDRPRAVGENAQTVAPGQKVAYLRVSTIDQNLDRQRESVGVVDKTFTDKASGKSKDTRQGLAEAIDYIRAGDTLVVSSIDRLARSLADLRSIVDQVVDKGARVEFVHEHMVFSADQADPRSTLMLGILGSFAEFERSIIRERQAEGIAAAKARGVYKGGKPKLTGEQVEQARARVASGVPKAAVAREVGVSRMTLYRALHNM